MLFLSRPSLGLDSPQFPFCLSNFLSLFYFSRVAQCIFVLPYKNETYAETNIGTFLRPSNSVGIRKAIGEERISFHGSFSMHLWNRLVWLLLIIFFFWDLFFVPSHFIVQILQDELVILKMSGFSSNSWNLSDWVKCFHRSQLVMPCIQQQRYVAN